MSVRNNVSCATGTYSGGATAFVGNTVAIGGAVQRVEKLAAHLVPNLSTSTFALTCKWQVSADGVNWVDVASAPQNPASVAFATGPAGVSAAKVIPAPDAVYGQKYARALAAGSVTTGASTDIIALGYDYRQVP